MLDGIKNIVEIIVENMLCFNILTRFEIGNKNCIVSKKTALVWFEFYFKSQPNQTKPHAFLSCGLDDFSPQNQIKPHRKHS